MIENFFERLLAWTKSLKYFYLRLRIKYRFCGYLFQRSAQPTKQSLDVYSDPGFFHAVSTWGLGTAWTEIQYLLINCQGRVLDMACGPCTIFPTLAKFHWCDFYGCDISRYYIEKAVELGVPRSKLTICDATRTPYENEQFDYSYSIGSLAQFTEGGIRDFLGETHRITKYASFHHIPVSRRGQNEGWTRLVDQSFFNNSVNWWSEKFKRVYGTVYVLDSTWESALSLGKWFICTKFTVVNKTQEVFQKDSQ